MDPPSACFKAPRAVAPTVRVERKKRKVYQSMAQTYAGQKRIRKFYGKIREVLEMPNLIEVQKSSYDLFLKSGDQDTPWDG